MKYKIKYIRALTFMFFFLGLAIFCYIRGENRIKNAENIRITEEKEAFCRLCNLADQVEKSYFSADKSEMKITAQLAIETISRCGFNEHDFRTIWNAFDKICTGIAGNDEKYLISTIANCNGDKDKISEICNCRMFGNSDEKSLKKPITTEKSKQHKFPQSSILCNDIIYKKTVVLDGVYYLYNSNQIIGVSESYNTIAYFAYGCQIGDEKYTRNELLESAEKFIFDNMHTEVYDGKFILTEESINHGIHTFIFAGNDNKYVFVSLRSDTGSIIYYNALDFYG